MTYKTPNVYIKDLTPPTPAVKDIATAVPAFVGYTARAIDQAGRSLRFRPTKIRNIGEFEALFGTGFQVEEVSVQIGGQGNQVEKIEIRNPYFLYPSLQLYFLNGGEDCYILSIGSFEDGRQPAAVPPPVEDPCISPDLRPLPDIAPAFVAERDRFTEGLAALQEEDEPTLILFPDAVRLKNGNDPDISSLGWIQQTARNQCMKLQDRFCLFDLIESYSLDHELAQFRDSTGGDHLSYAAAYHPWVYSSIGREVSLRSLSFVDHTGLPISIRQILGTQINSPEGQHLTSLLDRAEANIQEVNFMLSTAGIPFQQAEALPSLLKDLLLNFSSSDETENAGNFNANPAWKELIDWLSDLSLAFLLIDGNLSAPLQHLLQDAIPRYQLPRSIQRLLSLLTTAYSKGRYSEEESEVSNLLDRLSAFSGTTWLGNQSLEEIQPMEGIQSDSALYAVISEVGGFLVNGLQTLISQAKALEDASSAQAISGHPVLEEMVSSVRLEAQKIPPSGLIAGIIVRTDRERGVWKAPANVEIRQVLGPVRLIDDNIQEDMNVHATGKSVNAIRTFPGRGTVVWGSRTLDGNNLEWRYVPVRRLFIYVEELIKKTAERFVFEPNDANTWLILRNAIDSFLRSLWRRGAFYGATAGEAYDISVGLGQTMTAQDILEGKLIVEVGMAAARPAEFIVIRYECRMEES